MFHQKKRLSKPALQPLLILIILTLLTITGCGKIYAPTEFVSNLSESMSQEEALALLNNNITTPVFVTIYEGRRSNLSQIGDGPAMSNGWRDRYYHDQLSELKFNKNGINFIHYFKTINIEYKTIKGKKYLQYDRERHTLQPWGFSEIKEIGLTDSYGTKNFCINDTWGLYIGGKDRHTGFICCVENEDEVMAAFMKLAPNAELSSCK
ncbi:hypothetical protein JWG39_15830 [Desulforhopalus vacuolatus]|uniref:hypothetical protein n=1 Tax=Desulforhopalus vacuolatus TaxID=40414 RepID=UPI001964EDEC|nr:hypothetical protein [Desulforhopalus vacuolatus]MBM9521288.1 hypothetical protein [Desulforhopalus vacuolatus]